MKLLVLGGSKFVGRAFVEACLAAGHQVTLFNRGQSSPGLFPGTKEIHADRAVDLSGLDGLKFDAVFDSSGYFPRVVKMSASKLEASVGRYLYISSISVYQDPTVPNQDEDSPVVEADADYPEDVTGQSYGPLKVQCERKVESIFQRRGTVIRPGLIVGLHDTTDRFTYWPTRFSRGGEVLVPNRSDQPLQFIDARDLAQFCLLALERDLDGVFNVTGPQEAYRFGAVIDACWHGTGAERVWIDPKFLEDEGVVPWSELPLALPVDGSSDGLMKVNVRRAVSEGLSFRPLTETVADVRAWSSMRPLGEPVKAGISADREIELIAKWRSK